jgi:hypothetical protein
VIGSLERANHGATAAKMFLRRLESAQARHIADRNRLFKELADLGFFGMRYPAASVLTFGLDAPEGRI